MGDLGKSLLRALHPPVHVGTDTTKGGLWFSLCYLVCIIQHLQKHM